MDMSYLPHKTTLRVLSMLSRTPNTQGERCSSGLAQMISIPLKIKKIIVFDRVHGIETATFSSSMGFYGEGERYFYEVTHWRHLPQEPNEDNTFQSPFEAIFTTGRRVCDRDSKDTGVFSKWEGGFSFFSGNKFAERVADEFEHKVLSQHAMD